MKKINILLFIILALTGCQSGETEQLVSIENKYSVSLPSFLKKAETDLNEDASLQYLNMWKEFYIIVIDENQSELRKALIDNNLSNEYSDDINGYANLNLDGIESEVLINQKSELVKTEINEMPAILIDLNGKVNGIDVYYSLAFIEGKTRYYQIMLWTLSERETKYKKQMKKIIHSFKEI